MTELVPLPRYEYVGPHAGNPDLIQFAEHHLRTTGVETSAEEISYSEEYARQFEAMGTAMCELGADLGLDLTDRLRGPEYVHLYTRSEYANAVGQSEGSVAFNTRSGRMLAVKNKVPLTTLSRVNHEMVHVMSRKSIRPELTDYDGRTMVELPRSHDGYFSWRHKTFNGINEFFTEATNIDLMHNYWPHYPELADVASQNYEDIGYLTEMIFFDELLKARFADPRAAFKVMQRGMIAGKMGALRIMTDSVGAGVMGKIAHALSYENDDQALSLANELGLGEAVRKIKAYDKTDLLSWL